ncbi:MAG TPA: polysaccharide pyruvyl transferase family protein [Casimicrobiaceae bacterium]|jgi:exopolysaccharide biosynthesis predicted pyruvyltransferase EpsI
MRSQSSLETLLHEERGRPWLFVRPGGNWGDHLIYAGAEHLARKLKLTWASCEAADFARSPTSSEHGIYVHGGGGYNSWGSGRPFELLACAVARAAPLVVQGPQTIEDANEALRARFAAALAKVNANRVVFFAREPHSRDALLSLDLPACEITMDHDTAFHLDRDAIVELAALDGMPSPRYDLTALREDDEQVGAAHGAPARGVVLDPAYAADSFGHWLRIHLFARRLLTNRLHSAIVSALAGRPVTLALGSYHKNRSVFDYSLAARGVQWTDAIRAPADWWARLPRRLRDSYRLRKLRLRLMGVPTR